jgi:tetratricopeptide (TPR) repeat protein
MASPCGSSANRQYSQAEADRHNTLTKKGWAILNDHILLLGREQVRIGYFAKRRLKKAIGCFHQALRIAPEKYASRWALGKIYQVLGDHELSLKWFEDAWAVEKGNADVCREASLAAMDCGDFSKALDFSNKAISLKPEDAGLHCNRALALMFLNRDAEAIEAVANSLKLNPDDEIALNVRAIVHSVANGGRPRPKSMKEL